MWIRSQDKETLTNGDIIYYCNKYGMYTEIRCGKAGISDDYDLILAAYSTKEKALKVLDMIQKFICDYQHGEVFQMPQDDEVEEYIKKIEEAAKDKNFIKRTINSQKDFDAIETEVSEEW